MKFSDLKLTTPYLSLSPLFYDKVEVTPLKNAHIIALSQDAAKLLGVNEALNEDEELLSPFDEHVELEYLAKATPLSAKNIKLSCSS